MGKGSVGEDWPTLPKHGVFLVSDEIHQDLALFGHKHHSFNTINPAFKDFAIVLSSATKTFNIAGTKNSYAVIENPKLRVAYQKRQLANNQHEISGLGYLATEAAYRYGKDWLEELKQDDSKFFKVRIDSIEGNDACDQRGPNLGESHRKPTKHRVSGKVGQSSPTLPFPKHVHQDCEGCKEYRV